MVQYLNQNIFIPCIGSDIASEVYDHPVCPSILIVFILSESRS